MGKPSPVQAPFRREQRTQRAKALGVHKIDMINRDESDEPVGVDREQRAGEPRSRVGAQVGGHLYSTASAERPRQAATQRRGEPDMGGPRGRGVRGAVADEHQPATVEAGCGSGQQFLGSRR